MDWGTILLGAGIGGLVLFFWYAIAWMVLPHHYGDFAAAPDRAALEPALRALPPTRAFYMIPHMSEFAGGMKDPALGERMKQGPNAMILRTGQDCGMGGKTFGIGFLGNLVEALCLCLLLGMALPTVGHGLTHSLMLAVGAALFSGFAGLFALSNWMAFPWRFTLTSTLDRVLGYAGMVVVLQLCGIHPAGS